MNKIPTLVRIYGKPSDEQHEDLRLLNQLDAALIDLRHATAQKVLCDILAPERSTSRATALYASAVAKLASLGIAVNEERLMRDSGELYLLQQKLEQGKTIEYLQVLTASSRKLTELEEAGDKSSFFYFGLIATIVKAYCLDSDFGRAGRYLEFLLRQLNAIQNKTEAING
jgi:hypothetical protein